MRTINVINNFEKLNEGLQDIVTIIKTKNKEGVCVIEEIFSYEGFDTETNYYLGFIYDGYLFSVTYTERYGFYVGAFPSDIKVKNEINYMYRHGLKYFGLGDLIEPQNMKKFNQKRFIAMLEYKLTVWKKAEETLYERECGVIEFFNELKTYGLYHLIKWYDKEQTRGEIRRGGRLLEFNTQDGLHIEEKLDLLDPRRKTMSRIEYFSKTTNQ